MEMPHWKFPRERTAIRHPHNLSIAASRALTERVIRPYSIILDYGCGRGDDVRQLINKWYHIKGWEPRTRPELEKLLESMCKGMQIPKAFWPKTSDPTHPTEKVNVVLLSNVINVIEDVKERRETLKKAFFLATESLVITAYGDGKGKKWGDGVVTRIGTFQKPYAPLGFQRFIRNTLRIFAGDMWFHPKHNLAFVFTKQFDRATRKALGCRL
jgi:hypothetical protein